MRTTLKIQEQDNVSVALCELPSGAAMDGVVLTEAIPAGHKFALESISTGSPVIKYGYPIGQASADIHPGQWVHDHNVNSMLSGTREYTFVPDFRPIKRIGDERTFMGYPRANGDVGIRNELWVVPTVGCVNGLCEKAAAMVRAEGLPESVDEVTVFNHPYGCSQLGDDHEASRAILAGMVRHPNAGGVLVVGLGCENNTLDEFRKLIGPIDGERVRFVVAQDEDHELESCIKILRELRDLSAGDERVPVPVSRLRVGLKCGGSDALSGVTANPLVGAVSDRLIAHGATTVLTEIPEVFGAEAVLFNRCATEEVFGEAVSLVNDFKRYFLSHGEPVGENPSPGNKAGGITTLEDKSLGCVQKGGSAPLNGVVRYGCRVSSNGLNLLEGPGNDIVAVTALAAAGCHMVLFTTGRGTPLGGTVPVVKISSNSSLAEKKGNWIDFDAGVLLEGAEMGELAGTLVDRVIAVASGKRTCSEQNGYQDFAIWKMGVTL